MKIGIVTQFGYGNYGNRLQNYAVQELLQKKGHEVETMRFFYRKDRENSKFWWGRFLKNILPPAVVDRLRNAGLQYGVKSFIRYSKIGKWSKERIRTRNITVKTYGELKSCSTLAEYDYFVVGSDQVWNPQFVEQPNWLDFAPEEKRIGFIASVGVDKIPADLENEYKNGWKGMKCISVREKSAKKLIETYTDAHVECFFDPVMLVGKSCWENCMKKPKRNLPEKYMVCFFLGEVDENKIYQKYGSQIKIILIAEPYKRQDVCYGIEEFLYVMAHADCVLTDSFHGTVLSILFHKSFFVFERIEDGKKKMFTRLQSLLEDLDLSDCAKLSGFLESEDESMPYVDEKCFENADMIIEQERKAFDSWLEDTFI